MILMPSKERDVKIQEIVTSALAEIDAGGYNIQGTMVYTSYYRLQFDPMTGNDMSVSIGKDTKEYDGEGPMYTVHVVDDIAGSDAYILTTDSIENGELEAMLEEAIVGLSDD